MSNRILSYRGLLADGGQDTILLSTKKGEVGYRITKFQLMPYDIDGSNSHEDLVTIWNTKQATLINDVDFSDNRLLGAGYYVRSLNSAAPYVATISESTVIFDNVIFNQDIYVGFKTGQGGAKINYYIELEVIKLNETEAMVTTLKDIRSNS